MPDENENQKPIRVYLAGPMFSKGEKWEQDELGEALAHAGIECHQPHTQGIEVKKLMDFLKDPHVATTLPGVNTPGVAQVVEWISRSVAALDFYQAVEGCDCVVLNLDGRVPDEGSLVEATAAWYAGNPVIGFKTTPIAEFGFNNNPMIEALLQWTTPVGSFDEIADVVNKAMGRPAVGTPPPGTVPPGPIPSGTPTMSPNVEAQCALGKAVGALLANPPAAGAAQPVIDTLSAAPEIKVLEPISALQKPAATVVVTVIQYLAELLSKQQLIDALLPLVSQLAAGGASP